MRSRAWATIQMTIALRRREVQQTDTHREKMSKHKGGKEPPTRMSSQEKRHSNETRAAGTLIMDC